MKDKKKDQQKKLPGKTTATMKLKDLPSKGADRVQGGGINPILISTNSVPNAALSPTGYTIRRR